MRPDPSDCQKCFYLRLVAVLFWSAGLIALSLSPAANHHLYLFRGQDKLFHLLAYFLTAWLTCRSLQLFSLSVRKSVIISLIYCIFLGATLEIMQQVYTTSRRGELLDMVANFAGAILGCAVFCLQQKLSFKRYDH